MENNLNLRMLNLQCKFIIIDAIFNIYTKEKYESYL